jgi:predicted nucleic acid-binding protein
LAFTAVLDACVLVNARVRDTTLRAAEAGLYQLALSPDILEETRRAITGLGYPDDAVNHLIRELEKSFAEHVLTGYQGLIGAMENDPKDRHVLALAVRSHAGTIVTFNVRDFPRNACEPYSIRAQTPDDFLLDLWDLDPDRMAAIIHEQAQALKRPPMTKEELLDKLGQFVPGFVQQVREYLGE